MTEPDAPDTRPLVLSGGNPYILIVVEEPETGGVRLTTHGFDEDLDLPKALRELADLLVAA